MSQCQHCGNLKPASTTSIYCPKCQVLINAENAKIKKEQDEKFIKMGVNPDLVDGFITNTFWHLIGTPILILFTIPVISSSENWYWIVGGWEVTFLLNYWLGSANVYHSATEKYETGLTESERIAFVLINRIFTAYIIFIVTYYGYIWFVK
jgi:hypothetical protein